jgi:hypothetical protein
MYSFRCILSPMYTRHIVSAVSIKSLLNEPCSVSDSVSNKRIYGTDLLQINMAPTLLLGEGVNRRRKFARGLARLAILNSLCRTTRLSLPNMSAPEAVHYER